MADDDPREALGRIVNDTRNAFAAEVRPLFKPATWEQREPEQQELDMRIGAAVAAKAVADAMGKHLPLILGMLRVELVKAPHATAAKPYREALVAFRGSEEEGADHG